MPKKSKVKRNAKKMTVQAAEMNSKLTKEKGLEDENKKPLKYISPLIDESLRKIIR